MSIGKRKILIDAQNYLNSSDRFRQKAKKYWANTARKTVLFVKKDFDAHSDPNAEVPFSISFEEPRVQKTVQFYEIEQKVTIKASTLMHPKTVHADKLWREYVTKELFPDIKLGTLYYDHAFETSLPYSEHELRLLNLTQDVNTANVTPVYNFYIEEYEKQTKQRSIPEQVLPNIYALKQKEKNDSEGKIESDVDDLVSLGSQMPSNISNLKQKRKNRTHSTFQEEATERYFNSYGKYFSKLYRNRRNVYKEIRQKYSSVLISNEVVDNIGEYNEKKYLFPMYSKVEFLTDRNVYISKILKETNLSERLMRHVAAHDVGGTLPTVKFFEAHEKITMSSDTQHTKNSPKPNTDRILKIKNFNTFDLLEWWSNNVDNDEEISKILASSVMIGPSNKIMSVHDKIRNDYEKIITDLIFQSKFRKFVLSFFRSYEAILRGNVCYNEALVYKIRKYKGKPRGNPIQTYFLCNSSKQELMTMIDTQVKYNTEYTYVISAYQIVLGNQYYYKDLTTGTKVVPATNNSTESEVHLATFTTVTRPSIKVVEVPLYAEAELMMDTPPVAPDVDIIPYRGVNSRLLFNFKGSVGEYELLPIVFNEEERRHYRKIAKAQKREAGKPITFRSDDPAATFEIFRTTVKPKSYADFKNAKLASVYTDVSQETIQKASTASYVERILPNIKYYYTFRSIDVHGHISYPSAVYEVEIVDDAGAVFPIIKTIEFEERVLRTSSKPLKKYLYIIPNLNHAMLNLKKSGLLDEEGTKITSARTLGVASDGLQLGYQDDAIWNKRFKIRLTSNSTGRKLDLNLNFAHNHIITDDEFRNLGQAESESGVSIAGLLF